MPAGKWGMVALGAVSTLPVFALIVMLLPTQSGLALEMMRVRQPALVERVDALLAIGRSLPNAERPGSRGEGSGTVPADIRRGRLEVVAENDLPPTTVAALRPQGDPNAHMAIFNSNDACRKLQRYTLMPGGLTGGELGLAQNFCRAAVLSTLEPDELDFLSADTATIEINAVLEFDHLAVIRPIVYDAPNGEITPRRAGYFSAEVLVYEMNATSPAARLIIEATNAESVLGYADTVGLRGNLGRAARIVLEKRLGVLPADTPDPFTAERLEDARRGQ